MSIDTLQPSPRRLIKLTGTSGTSSRNSEFHCPVKSSPGIRKPSAVERLEADKAKYVKSQQVAQKKQQPVISSSNNSSGPSAPQPTRKVSARPTTKSEAPPLNLEHLCKLIDGISDTTVPVVPSEVDDTGKAQDDVCKPLSPTLSVTEESSLGSTSTSISQGKTVVEASSANGCPTMTVRRVDVRPQLPQMRMTSRAQLQSRTPAQSSTHPVQLLHLLRPQHNQNPIAFRRLQNIENINRGPIKPPSSPAQTSPSSKTSSSQFNTLPLPVKPKTELLCTSQTPLTPTAVTSLLASNDIQSPPSPAITNRSSSSRKRPSLTRSKSDVSDCFSRAGAELERFFNYCGLDPSDIEELTRPGSDIVSVSRLRSASAPASERTAEGEDDEEEEAVKEERPGYGISVIERNARVIKWLYGMRQAKDSPKVANM